MSSFNSRITIRNQINVQLETGKITVTAGKLVTPPPKEIQAQQQGVIGVEGQHLDPAKGSAGQITYDSVVGSNPVTFTIDFRCNNNQQGAEGKSSLDTARITKVTESTLPLNVTFTVSTVSL